MRYLSLKLKNPTFFRSFYTQEVDVYPKLTLLEQFAHKINFGKTVDFSKIHLIAVQHLLPTTESLFEILKREFNLKTGNCWVTGKCYSTCPPVAEQLAKSGIHIVSNTIPQHYGCYYEKGMLPDIDKLWNNFMQNYEPGNPVLILDDGGDLIIRMPEQLKIIARQQPGCVIGIEQTTNGIVKLEYFQAENGELPCPVINVARSGAKRLESPLIAHSITSQLQTLSLLREHKLNCGIIGRGFIGHAVAKTLLDMKHKVLIHETNEDKHIKNGVRYAFRLTELFDHCDIIFGCTASDPFTIEDIPKVLKKITRPVTLVSCSSADSQFGNFLRFIQTVSNKEAHDILADIEFNDHANLKILGGGFPFNFTRTPACDPPHLFAFTRALLLAALLNGWELLINQHKVPNQFIQLAPTMQKYLIEQWLYLTPEARIIHPEIDIPKIIAYSEGNPFSFELDELLMEEEETILLPFSSL